MADNMVVRACDGYAGKAYRRFAIMIVVGATLLPTSTYAQRVAVTSRPTTATTAQRVTLDVDNMPLSSVLAMIGRQVGLRPSYDVSILPPDARVTLHVHAMPVIDALHQVLHGAGLSASLGAAGSFIVVRDAMHLETGTLTGKVTDASTKLPLRGVTIALDDATRGVLTGDDGTFRLSDVAAGSHHVTARIIGHSRQVKSVVVTDGESTTVDFVLSTSATALDQVVVTGTVIPTELKAVPNAITVITAKQIEERGITHIDQLFHGDVPGLFAMNQGANALLDQVTMFSRGVTAISDNGGSTQNLTNPIKTYVDGIELADPRYLSQIDPRNIERIEILAGPQASTIYGSNAINGVMQIFTKRGASARPQLTLNLLSGWVENNFSSARTPQHDYSAQLSGLEGRLSYNAGTSWNYIGPWTPAKQTTRVGASGGTKLELPTPAGTVRVDVSLRRDVTRNMQHGVDVQTFVDFRAQGLWSPAGGNGRSVPTASTLTGQTLGLTLSYSPTAWWSHEFGMGQDASDTETQSLARGYTNSGDTTLSLSQIHVNRRSLRYTTTGRIPVTVFAQATVTLGADAWQSLNSSIDVATQTLTGTLSGPTNVSRQPGHNTGGFLQTQVSIRDQLFLTYGLRAEWNPNYGVEAEPNYAPRYGVAYTQDVGPVTAKLRASYGRSTRPPAPSRKAAITATQFFGSNFLSPDYGEFNLFIDNPALAPERQQGGEGGLELYFGARGSLIITRYNQTVDALIDNAWVDSVRSLAPNPVYFVDNLDANGYGYWQQFQYVNVGNLRNEGWELQGSVNTGPITTRGTYSWTKSRVIGADPRYRQFFPEYQPGKTFNWLPEHTWAGGVTYTHARTAISLDLTGTGQMRSANTFSWAALDFRIRLQQNRARMSSAGYFNHINGYTLANLAASQGLSSRLDGVLQVQNLGNYYANDYNAAWPTMGRQLKGGLRCRF